MFVKIKLGDEVIKFNLQREIAITDDNNMESYVKEHPTQYGFLLMVRSRLIQRKSEQEAIVDKVWGKIWAKAKRQTISNRAPSNDYCDQKVKSDEDYLTAISILNQTKRNLNDIEACIKSFEVRKDLLQTYSANRRKEI